VKRMVRLLRDTFVSGLLVILPAGLTLYVLWLIFRMLNALLGPQTALSRFLTQVFGRYIPGTEILIIVAVVVLVGAVARYWLGKRIVTLLEQGVLALPGLRKVYWASRQLAHALLKREVIPGQHKRLVLVEFPKAGSYVIGFLTSDELAGLDAVFGAPVVSVYIPTAPNPLSGWVLFLPRDKVIPLELTMDEGFSLVLSGGVVVPQRLQTKEVADADQA